MPLPSLAVSPADPAFYRDPYPTYRRMRGLGDLFVWTDYGFPCSARYGVVNAALRDRRFGREILHVATRAELGWPEPPEHLAPFTEFQANSMLEREPPVHTRLRGLVNRAFVGRAVERLAPDIARATHDLIDAFAADGRAELMAAFATPIPIAVICGLIGAPREDSAQLLDWSHRMVAMHQFGRTAATEHDAAAATAAFAEYIAALVAERRRRPGEDLLSGLIAARDEADRLTEAELSATAIQLLNAGHEATVNAIGNAILVLLVQDADPAAAFAGPETTALAVEETLRFEAPLHLFTRYALEDLDFAGHRFAKGDKIGLLLAAGNRDPERFDAPDSFRPDRPITPNLSFGAGIHFCVGAPLARLELAAALPILFRRLPRLTLDGPPRWRDAFSFHGLDRLDVVW